MKRLLCFLGLHRWTAWHIFIDFRTGGTVDRRHCYYCPREEER